MKQRHRDTLFFLGVAAAAAAALYVISQNQASATGLGGLGATAHTPIVKIPPIIRRLRIARLRRMAALRQAALRQAAAPGRLPTTNV